MIKAAHFFLSLVLADMPLSAQMDAHLYSLETTVA